MKTENRGCRRVALETALREGRFEAEAGASQDGGRFWANVVSDPIRDERGDHLGSPRSLAT